MCPAPMNQTPSENQPQAPAAPETADTSLEPVVREFWAKNRNLVLGLCAAVLLAIVVREGWRYYADARDREVQAAFAKAGSDATRLGRFAADHAGHPLAGVALLRVADGNFAAGDFKAAAEGYGKAAGALKLDALLGRAKLGQAVSRLRSGDAPGGEAALKAVSADVALPAPVRAEAAYHLATLAVEAGRNDEAVKLTEEISKLDAVGAWAQRAAVLRASVEVGAPAPAAPAANESAPLFKPGGE